MVNLSKKQIILLLALFSLGLILLWSDSALALTTTCKGRTSTSNWGTLSPSTSWQTRSGYLLSGGTDTDRYEFYVSSLKLGTYEFSLCSSDGGSAAFDTYICLFKGSTSKASNDDYCGLQSKISYDITSTGYWYIQISAYSSSGYGSYVLAYKRSAAAPTNCAQAGCDNYASGGDCWCDSACVEAGDCCYDACSVCGYCPVGPPTARTDPATNVEETTATLKGCVTDTGGADYRVRFQWGDTSSYGSNSSWTGYYNYTTCFTLDISGLTRGKTYHFRIQAQNSAGYGYGSDRTFITKPNPPSSFSATAVSESQINLSWSKGSGAYYTMVRRKTGSYPTSPSDGSQVYYGTGTSKSDTGLSSGTTYYYRAWSRGYEEGYYSEYSDSYASDYATTEAAKIDTKIDCAFSNCIFDKTSVIWGGYADGEQVAVGGYLKTTGGAGISGKYLSLWWWNGTAYEKVTEGGMDSIGPTNSSGYAGKYWKPFGSDYYYTNNYILFFAGVDNYNQSQTVNYGLRVTCDPTCYSLGAMRANVFNIYCATCEGVCGWFGIIRGGDIGPVDPNYDSLCTLKTDCYFPRSPFLEANKLTNCDTSATKCQTDHCPNYSGWNGEKCTVRYTNCEPWVIIGEYNVVNYGKWDASDRKCVQCDVYHKETANCGDTSGIYLECNYGERENAPCTGTADNKCESACGADSFADEQPPNSCSLVNCGYGNSLRLDCYTAACATYDGPCSSNCGAIDPGCDGKNPGDSCGVGGTCDDSCKCIEACTRANPSVSLSPSSQSGNPGDTKSYTATITNNDSSACGDSTFNLTKSCPSGWTCSLSSTSKTISPGSSASVTLSVTSPATATAGDYTVSVTATNSAATSYSGTDSATYTVIVEAACAPGETEVIMDNFPSDGATVTKTVNAPTGEQFAAGTLSTFYATGDLNSCSSEYFNAYVEGSQINANYCTGYQDCTYHQVDSNVGITSYISGKTSFQLKAISSAGTDAGYTCPGTAIKVKWCLDLSSETVVDNPPQITINCPECAPIKNIGDVVSVIVSATDDYGLNQLYLAVRGEQPNPQDFFHPCGGATPCAFSRDITLDYAGTDPDIGDWTFWGNAEDTTGQWGSYVFAGVYDVFDFNLSVSPNSGSIEQGQSILTTVAANLLSSASRSVSFSASGLPSGASVSFSPASCSPTCDSTMTITTSPTTPTGTYSVTIKGENGNLVRTTTYNLTVTAVTYTLSVSKDGTGSGTVTDTGINCGTDCTETYNTGTSVTLTASPAAGSTFDGWSGDCSGTGSCTLTMNFNKSVTATFNLSDTTPPTTTISPNGKDWVNYDVGFTLSCDDGVGGTGCQTTQYKIIDASQTCDISGLTTGTSGTVTCPTDQARRKKVCFRSIDNAGNPEGIKTSNLFKIDKAAPTTE